METKAKQENKHKVHLYCRTKTSMLSSLNKGLFSKKHNWRKCKFVYKETKQYILISVLCMRIS